MITQSQVIPNSFTTQPWKTTQINCSASSEQLWDMSTWLWMKMIWPRTLGIYTAMHQSVSFIICLKTQWRSNPLNKETFCNSSSNFHSELDWESSQNQCTSNHCCSTLERLVSKLLSIKLLCHDVITFHHSAATALRLQNLPVTFSGGLRDDATGLHSFLFMARKGKDNEVT